MSDLTLTASVGLNGANEAADVSGVQQLLNQIPRQHGGSPRPALPNSGRCDVDTIVAIKRLQWRLWPQRRSPVDGLVEPGGSTLREMNRLANGQPPVRPRPAGQRGTAAPLYITEMWTLVQEMHTRNLDVYPYELLLGIFWEETNFMNIRGRRRTDMIGFGQVREGNFRAINRRYNRSYTAAGVLNSNAQSVEIASLTLDNALTDALPRGAARRDRRSALIYYAHGPTGGWNPSPWLRGMSSLQGIPVSRYMSGQIPDLVGVCIRESLWEARPSSVWSPDLALPPEC